MLAHLPRGWNIDMFDYFKLKRQASLNGLPFLFEDQTHGGGGRRIVRHEFPNGSNHYDEDLGPNAGTLSVKGYFIGPNAMEQALGLKAMCDAGGIMRLVLPDNPFILVQCNNVSISNNKDVTNLVKIDFSFYENSSFGLGNIISMVGRVLEIGLGNAVSAVGRMMGGGLNG